MYTYPNDCEQLSDHLLIYTSGTRKLFLQKTHGTLATKNLPAKILQTKVSNSTTLPLPSLYILPKDY